MRINHEELKDLFKRFRWIDNILEDQNRRDEICVEARAALLLEANINSEMFPAFLRRKKIDKYRDLDFYALPHPVSLKIEQIYTYWGCEKKVITITLPHFEYVPIEKLNAPSLNHYCAFTTSNLE